MASRHTNVTANGIAGSYDVTVTARGVATPVVFSLTNMPLILSVYKVGQGSGSVTSMPAAVDCGSVCISGYNYGAVVTLTATRSCPHAVLRRLVRRMHRRSWLHGTHDRHPGSDRRLPPGRSCTPNRRHRPGRSQCGATAGLLRLRLAHHPHFRAGQRVAIRRLRWPITPGLSIPPS